VESAGGSGFDYAGRWLVMHVIAADRAASSPARICTSKKAKQLHTGQM
jgi:hypothetical protein